MTLFANINDPIRYIKKICNIFHRFPLAYATQEAMSVVFRKILRCQYVKSYAEKGEDLALAAMMRKVENGYYVEVGCYHPIQKSNTFHLYKQGWHGVVIDANPVHLDTYRRIRTKDIVVEAVVSNSDYETELICFQESAYSTISQTTSKAVNSHSAGNRSVRNVRTKTLTKILDECDTPQAFNLLSIDCEGHDFEVLQSLDLKRYQPEVIIIEDHKFSIEHWEENNIVRHLKPYGYKLSAFCLNNLYLTLSSTTNYGKSPSHFELRA